MCVFSVLLRFFCSLFADDCLRHHWMAHLLESRENNRLFGQLHGVRLRMLHVPKAPNQAEQRKKLIFFFIWISKQSKFNSNLQSLGNFEWYVHRQRKGVAFRFDWIDLVRPGCFHHAV